MMTEDDLDVVWALGRGPGSPPQITPKELLARVGEPDGRVLALRLLAQGIDGRSSKAIEAGVFLAAVFGIDSRFLPSLSELVSMDWHTSHEDIVSLLDDLRDPRSISSLTLATGWVPEYLSWDQAHALGVKAVYALWKLGTPEAKSALEEIARTSPWEPVYRTARERLALL